MKKEENEKRRETQMNQLIAGLKIARLESIATTSV